MVLYIMRIDLIDMFIIIPFYGKITLSLDNCRGIRLRQVLSYQVSIIENYCLNTVYSINLYLNNWSLTSKFPPKCNVFPKA